MWMIVRNWVRGAFVISCICTPTLAQQRPNLPGITGQVLAADGGAPLRRTRIEVSAGAWRGVPVLTDNDGRFFVEIPGAGTVSLAVTITKAGYVTASTRVDRKNAQTPVLIHLSRAAAISGIVVDSTGTPVAGIGVTARPLDSVAASQMATPSELSTATDDLGEYRVAGLSRGRYEIQAGGLVTFVGDSSIPIALTKYAGGGPRTVVTIEAAEEISGVQLTVPAEASADAALRMLRDRAVLQIQSPTSEPPSKALPRDAGGGIRGRVLSDTGTPVAGATVRLVGVGSGRFARTSADGVYTFIGLAAGHYTIEVLVNERMSWQYGQDTADQAGRPVAVAADQTIEGIDIAMPPGRAVTGLVADEHGEPIQGARVQALSVQHADGRLVAVPAGSQRRTDDRGRYRLWGLLPGSYLLTAQVDALISGRSGRQTAYATVYYPGTPSIAEAMPIDLRNDATANLVFAPFGLSEIRGLARDGDAPLVSGTARLVESRRSASLSAPPRTAPIQMDGSFILRNVPPGHYVLQVLGDGPGRTGLFGVEEVSVGLDPIQVRIKTSHGTSVEGRVVVEGRAALTCTAIDMNTGVRIDTPCVRGAPPFTIGTVPLDDSARDPTSGVIISSGEFFAVGLFGPTSFALRSAPGDDWYLKSFTINGSDILETGFDFGNRPNTISDSEIVLSQNGAAVTGRVEEGANATHNYFVVAFPTSRNARAALARRVKFARSGTDGSFRIAGLPGGDYFLAAVSRLSGSREGGEWQDADVLAQLEQRAERVTLTDGQTRTVTLRLIQR
jgi:hypothetical protein